MDADMGAIVMPTIIRNPSLNHTNKLNKMRPLLLARSLEMTRTIGLLLDKVKIKIESGKIIPTFEEVYAYRAANGVYATLILYDRHYQSSPFQKPEYWLTKMQASALASVLRYKLDIRISKKQSVIADALQKWAASVDEFDSLENNGNYANLQFYLSGDFELGELYDDKELLHE